MNKIKRKRKEVSHELSGEECHKKKDKGRPWSRSLSERFKEQQGDQIGTLTHRERSRTEVREVVEGLILKAC